MLCVTLSLFLLGVYILYKSQVKQKAQQIVSPVHPLYKKKEEDKTALRRRIPNKIILLNS